MASSEELLRAVQLATRTLSGSGRIDDLLPSVLSICVEAVGASGGTIYLHDDINKSLVFRHVLPESVREKIQFGNIPEDFGVAGECFQTRRTIISNFLPKERDNEIEQQTGVSAQSMITVPLMMQDEAPIGVVQLINKLDGDFDESDATVLDTVSAVSTLAYLNSKLADEATRASTLLGMGKVSHDIGNLAASLYANITFSEFSITSLKAASEGQEKLTPHVEAVDEMMVDLKKSVDRIVGYSRLISDLSANRQLRPNKALAPLGETIELAASYLESEARNNGVEIRYDIQPDGPPWEFDDQFIFRIVQNLVGNAIKAVRESQPSAAVDSEKPIGFVEVGYHYGDGKHVLSVQDSGAGMTREVADRILAGSARSMWQSSGGSGWGTKIVLELVASHGGTVEIESELGIGSKFRAVFPA